MVEVPVVYLGVIVVERISNILTTLRIPRDDVISAQLGLFGKVINWYQLSASKCLFFYRYKEETFYPRYSPSIGCP